MATTVIQSQGMTAVKLKSVAGAIAFFLAFLPLTPAQGNSWLLAILGVSIIYLDTDEVTNLLQFAMMIGFSLGVSIGAILMSTFMFIGMDLPVVDIVYSTYPMALKLLFTGLTFVQLCSAGRFLTALYLLDQCVPPVDQEE